MPYFNIVAQTTENTVVTEYEPLPKRSDGYQSEAALEQEFIRMLSEQGYEYLAIHTESELLANLRAQLEKLNNYTFSDAEWDRFLKENVANPTEHIVEKTRKIQEDYVQVLRRDDGTGKNILLIDKKNVHNNFLQVINQYVIGREDGAKHDNRYDVTVLVNGLPLVHIELKRRGVAMRHGCTIEIERFWYNSITGTVSPDRIPFNNGYLSGLSCQLFHNGKLVEFGNEEIALTTCWLFSSVRKIIEFPCFWNSHLEVVLSTDTSDVKEELEEWVKLLQKNVSSLQDLN